ncbi:HlyD family type I secretion periplasmic adaptor subunit [Mongoliimonas terrestris]|uniref:HlyD family type I secretion periplasmic adaptor subunit n=1 Tax=Mongoliimonas terrestris TaxID=1709001 RepID=UPI0009497682|nr:HlyD family type I secretion periplasmic adaptor subunit [Mongoliimonas terrestris]
MLRLAFTQPVDTAPALDPDGAPSVTGHILAVALAAATLFGGFGLWSAVAPLASAVISGGQLQLERDAHPVAHIDGGLIASVRVQEGDRVAAGDLLLRLDDVTARASLAALESEREALEARRIRLAAERDGLDRPAFDPAEAGEAAVAAEMRIFVERRLGRAGQAAIQARRKAELMMETKASRAARDSLDDQLALMAEELSGAESLARKGFYPKSRLLALQRAEAGLRGSLLAEEAQLEQVAEEILKVDQETEALRQDHLSAVVTEIAEVERRLADLDHRRQPQSALLARRNVVAPVSGRVHDIAFATEGNVVSPGQRILTIIPDDGRFVIDARVRPQDIDKLHVGQEARIRFPSLPSRLSPEIGGTLATLAADLSVDAKTGAAYYKARMQVDPAALATVGETAALVSGMPVEAHITTGQRTLFDYLVQPMTDLLARGARET